VNAAQGGVEDGPSYRRSTERQWLADVRGRRVVGPKGKYPHCLRLSADAAINSLLYAFRVLGKLRRSERPRLPREYADLEIKSTLSCDLIAKE
jgi:hypothetical protein